MGAKDKYPVTPAVRALREAGVPFEHHLYDYVEKGGTARSAQCLGVPEHAVVKTLVMEDDGGRPLIVLQHGDREVSTAGLARAIGARDVRPCSPEAASRHTGYLVGGTSPFGTRKRQPVYMEATILDLPLMYVNGGKRGYLVALAPAVARRLLEPTLVTVGVAP
jgi:Cys-tRNA(Pro) deacylase